MFPKVKKSLESKFSVHKNVTCLFQFKWETLWETHKFSNLSSKISVLDCHDLKSGEMPAQFAYVCHTSDAI